MMLYATYFCRDILRYYATLRLRRLRYRFLPIRATRYARYTMPYARVMSLRHALFACHCRLLLLRAFDFSFDATRQVVAVRLLRFTAFIYARYRWLFVVYGADARCARLRHAAFIGCLLI